MDGGCNCGAIKVSLKVKPTRAAICHCTVCSRFTGNPGSYFLVLPTADAVVTGNPKGWTSTSEKGRTVTRWFCGDCGCSLYATGEWPGPNGFHAFGGIFPQGRPAPASAVWEENKEEWHNIHVDAAYEKQGNF